MSLGMQRKFGAEKRGDEVLWVDPDKVIITTDINHPCYDKRGLVPPPRSFVNGVKRSGVKKLPPIYLRYEGVGEDGCPLAYAVDGRQRTQAVRIINEGNGWGPGHKSRLLLQFIPFVGTDQETRDAVIILNESRVKDSLAVRIANMKRKTAEGKTDDELCEMFGISAKTLGKWRATDDLSDDVACAVMDESLSLEAALPLTKMPRAEQSRALREMREEGTTIGPSAARAAKKKADRGKPKEPVVRAMSRKGLLAAREAVLAKPKRTRYHEGVLAALAYALGEADLPVTPEGDG